MNILELIHELKQTYRNAIDFYEIKDYRNFYRYYGMCYVYEQLLLEQNYSLTNDEILNKLSNWVDDLDHKISLKWMEERNANK